MQAPVRASQVSKILAAYREVHRELRAGSPASLARAVAVLYAAQRVATPGEADAADALWLAELRSEVGV